MKTIMWLSIGLLVPIAALATSTPPVPTGTGNVTTLVQINACEECDSINQVNTAIVIQDIRQRDALVYVPRETQSEIPRAELVNMTSIIQENFCIDCIGVDQRNIALVIQNITPDTVALWRGATSLAGLNTVEITQVNTCLDCIEDEQENVAVVIQNLRPEDCFLYIPETTTLDISPAELVNILTVIQDNFCVDCDDVVQDSLALVIQNINPDDIVLIPK